MMHSDMLSLLKQLVEVQNVHFMILEPPYDQVEHFDLGLRNTLYKEYSFKPFLDFLNSLRTESVLYHYTDTYFCNYSFFPINVGNQTDTSYIIIGPYLAEAITTNQFQIVQERISLPKNKEKEIREYYNALPVFIEITRFYSLLSIMAAQILDNPSAMTVQFLENFNEANLEQFQYRSDAAPAISSKMIADRYKAENAILKYVAQGNAEKAQIALHNFLQYQIAPRFKDPIRNIKNLTIVLNTLLRKAVESSNVHPIHIDEVSRNFAIRIESIHSLNEVDELQTLMIRRYCLLVTNHSLTGYSPLVQKVINHIDMNLSQALSLRQLADLFSINPSYLSTLFKKEMGITMTDFINQQKIRYAITLLNSTDTQIQNIASQVGIDDVNYFIKVFKKINGMTPKEYRDTIKGRREL